MALKVPHPGMLADARIAERFLREARAAARLRHPHIVPFYEVGQDGPHLYLASAFIAGQTLADALHARSFDCRGAARIVQDLAEALAYAHGQGIVHRDVKPSNVLLGRQDHAYLTDFGLAHLQEASRQLTQEGAILGTPSYMAPEQAQGKNGEAQPASDQYSLGVVLYELLCGQTPFNGPAHVLIFHHLHTKPPRPCSLNPSIPPDLEAICLKALAKRPDKRYASCREMADDIRGWLGRAPIETYRASRPHRMSRPHGRKLPTGLLAAVFFLVLVVTGVLGFLAGGQQAPQTDNPPVPPDLPADVKKVPPPSPKPKVARKQPAEEPKKHDPPPKVAKAQNLMPTDFQKGVTAFEGANYDEAIRCFGEVIRLDAKHALAHAYRGAAWVHKRNFDKAIADCTQAIHLDPKCSLAHSNRGAAYLMKKEYDKAIADCTEAIRLEPKYAPAFYTRGDAWSAKKEYDLAIKDFDEAIRLDPKYALAYHKRGHAHFMKHEFDKAIADCTQAIHLNPKFAPAFNNRGNVWSAKKEYDLSIKDYDETIRLDPKFAVAFNNRGNAYLIKKEYDKAIADCTEALRLDPKYALAYNNRAAAYLMKKEYDKVIADCTEAVRLNPKFSLAYFNRSTAYGMKKEYDKAAADYQKAVRLDSK